MQEIIKDELDKYKDILLKNNILDLENLKGSRLKKAIKVINKHKREQEKAINKTLDLENLRKIRHFL